MLLIIFDKDFLYYLLKNKTHKNDCRFIDFKKTYFKISGKKIVLYAAIWYDLKICKLIRFPSPNLKKIFRLIAEPGAPPHLPLQSMSGQAQLE
jgi:hypothetical protein